MLETLDLTTEIGLSAERPTWIELIRPIGPNAKCLSAQSTLPLPHQPQQVRAAAALAQQQQQF
jgi:hypothetical protein